MKKIFYFFVLIVVLISFASCKADSGTNAKVDDNAAAAEIDTTMPPPFEESASESGGDEKVIYYAPMNFFLSAIPYDLIQSVGVDKYEQWKAEIKETQSDRYDIENSINLYSFCKYFKISNEQLESFIEEQMQIDKENGITDSWDKNDLEILLSDDINKIRQHFISEYAILSNDKIYTPEWIYTHTIQAYEAEEIPSEFIEEKMELYKDIPFSAKALDALEKKLNSYLQMDLTFDKDAKKTKEETSSSETSPAQTASTDAATSSETHNETSVTD